MRFLAPLGFLAAISIAVLIAIYIIKPNYQQKYVSSTYIWKLSLKYKKKRIPTSKLRDILIVVCQVAILACCAAVLAQPAKVIKALFSENEVVIVLDCSASMRAKKDDESRFDRALALIEEQAKDVAAAGGYVTLIRADDKPQMLLSHVGESNFSSFNDLMADLHESDDYSLGFDATLGCGYGGADIDGAMELTEAILESNPDALVYVYTDSTYLYVPSGVNVVDCRSAEGGSGEWNVAILDASAEFFENYYLFSVKVGAYGSENAGGVATTFDLYFTVTGHDFNGDQVVLEAKQTVTCNDGEEKTIVFRHRIDSNTEVVFENEVEYAGVSDFSKATIMVFADDCFLEDNSFVLPGSEKPTLKIQYASSLRTPFFESLLDVLSSKYFKDTWNVKVTSLKPNQTPAVSGFDFYIFEACTPKSLPEDGVSFFVACDSLPRGVSLSYSGKINKSGNRGFTLSSSAADHAIMRNVNAEEIEITQSYVLSWGQYDGYTSIMDCSGNCVFAVKNDVEGNERVAVMGFISQYSNITIKPEFPLLVANLINYYHPATISKSIYSVGEEIEINCRGDKVKVYPSLSQNIKDDAQTFETFPSKLVIYKQGNFIFNTSMNDGAAFEYSQDIFVRMPQEESNINAVIESLADPNAGSSFEDFFEDFAKYFALALVILAFAEWFLHIREGI